MNTPSLTHNHFEDTDNPEEKLRKDIEQMFQAFHNEKITRPTLGELLDELTAEYHHYTRE